MTTVVLIAGPAQAHTRLKDPVPRTNDADLKDGNGGAPCGGKARTSTPKVYTMGQTVNVQWEETVNHAGCFLIRFSQANDQGFTMLANPNHSGNGGVPRQYNANVTLPAGVTCDNCTMQLIQVMSTITPCPINNIPTGAAYYSCADIKIVAPGGTGGGAGGTAGGRAGGSAGTAGGSVATAGGAGGGSEPVASAGGAETENQEGGLSGGLAEGGCSSVGTLSALSLLAAAVLIRRKHRSR